MLTPTVETAPAREPTPYPQPRNSEELWALLQNPQSTAHGARHLGDALVQSGLVTRGQLESALRSQHEERLLGVHRQLGQLLVEQGLISDAQLRHVIAGWLGNRVLDPQHFQFEPEALEMVPGAVAEREAVLPLMQHEDLLVVLMADPLDKRLLDELRFMTQRRIVAVLAAPGTLPPAIDRAYQHPTAASVPVPSGSARPPETWPLTCKPAATRAASPKPMWSANPTTPWCG